MTSYNSKNNMSNRQMAKYNFAENQRGELTGEELQDVTNVYDKGMPFRSTYTLIRKQQNDDNNHNDFDLFNKIDRTDKNVTYVDSHDSNFADLNDPLITVSNNVNPYETCINDISSTTCWLNSNMSKLTSDYILNGYGFFSLFGIIYLTSRGNTELVLKNYFNFQNKKHLNASLLTFNGEINDYRNQIIFDNYFIHNNKIPYNKNSFNGLKQLVKNIVIDKNNMSNEIERINNIILKNSHIKNAISMNTLTKSDLSIISIAKLKPIWLYPVDKTQNNLRWVNKSFNYFEDTERQIIELPLMGKSFVFGIVNRKTNGQPIDYKTLSLSFKYMKKTMFDEVIISIIKKMYKLRLNKTLLKTGLNIETLNDIIGLYPEHAHIDDCIQYIDIDIGNTNNTNDNIETKGDYRSSRRFIINTTYEFYLKHVDTNCIMLIGKI